MEAVTVDEGLRLLETEDGLREQVMKRVMGRLEQHVKRRAGEGLRQRPLYLPMNAEYWARPPEQMICLCTYGQNEEQMKGGIR